MFASAAVISAATAPATPDPAVITVPATAAG
jgi:hypothetical protein